VTTTSRSFPVAENVSVDIDAFTVMLAHRLAAVVPAGFYVKAADGMLRYTCDEGRFPGQQGNYRCGEVGVLVRDNFSLHGETEADNLAGAATQALDALQDYVSEATHDPWPGTRSQPSPYARISGGALQLGYGEPGDVVLGCAPIRLADVRAL
jgi:hypothetical protein